jgi:hypothetical protein
VDGILSFDCLFVGRQIFAALRPALLSHRSLVWAVRERKYALTGAKARPAGCRVIARAQMQRARDSVERPFSVKQLGRRRALCRLARTLCPHRKR